MANQLIKHCDSCTCNDPKVARAPLGPEETTVRIVKPGHIFMKTKGGQAVEVPTRDIAHRSTLLATYSVEEWKQKTEEARRSASPQEPKINSVELASQFKAKAKQSLAAQKTSDERGSK